MCQRCCRRFEIFAQQEYRSPGSSETGRKHMADFGLSRSLDLQTKSFFMSMKSPFWLPRTFLTLHGPGLIYFRKRFLMGLYEGGGGLIYGWAYTWTIFCVSNKQVRHKQVSHKQGNKRVLSSDYWA